MISDHNSDNSVGRAGAPDAEYALSGETVKISYLADPKVSYGQFLLKNNGPSTAIAVVTGAWLELGAQRLTLTGVTVFDLSKAEMINHEGFTVPPGGVIHFTAGFPGIDYEPRFGESSAVGLCLTVNGVVLQAKSALEFERRIPPRR